MIKIAITGPESTGKSTLCKALANTLQCAWVPEFARDYLIGLERTYTYKDLLIIAKGQIESEKQAAASNPEIMICDTELTVIKIWSEYKYKKCDPWITQQLQHITYDLYLLCDIDIPWEFDELREHPEHRQYFFNLYVNEMESRKLPYHIISGNADERYAKALKIIDAVKETA